MPARRGRPPGPEPRLTREAILSAAAGRLDRTNDGTFSLRLLAADLGVTPMALYAHVEGLDGILNALAERWFADLPADIPQDPAADLRALLLWYCAGVLRHPGLTSALVSRLGALPAPHQTWTDRITRHLGTLGLSADWRDILVDHLHGHALSHAAAGTAAQTALDQYRTHLDLLLGAALPRPPSTPG
jgi:AcrR family transcriptional regulator